MPRKQPNHRWMIASVLLLVLYTSATSPAAHARHEAQGQDPVCTFHIGFNTAKDPFDDPEVRQAFAAAIDRPEIVTVLGNNTVQAALTFTPPGVFGHVNGFTAGIGIEFDAALAQQKLASAGYPNGQGMPPMEFVYADGVTGDDSPIVTQLLQGYWFDTLAAGVELEVVETNDFYGRLLSDAPQIWYFRRCAYDLAAVEATYFLDEHIDTWRGALGGWTNVTYEDLLAEALGTADPVARQSFYRQAEEILVEFDAVIVPLYYSGVAASSSFTLYVPVVHR